MKKTETLVAVFILLVLMFFIKPIFIAIAMVGMFVCGVAGIVLFCYTVGYAIRFYLNKDK